MTKSGDFPSCHLWRDLNLVNFFCFKSVRDIIKDFDANKTEKEGPKWIMITVFSLFWLLVCGVGRKTVLRVEMEKIFHDLLMENVRFLLLSKPVDRNIQDTFWRWKYCLNIVFQAALAARIGLRKNLVTVLSTSENSVVLWTTSQTSD